jgi:hypothetical protein
VRTPIEIGAFSGAIWAMTKSRGIGRGGARPNSGPRPKLLRAALIDADPATVDPARILAAICLDPGVVASTRVQAAKALALMQKAETPGGAERSRREAIGARAVRILGERGLN